MHELFYLICVILMFCFLTVYIVVHCLRSTVVHCNTIQKLGVNIIHFFGGGGGGLILLFNKDTLN